MSHLFSPLTPNLQRSQIRKYLLSGTTLVVDRYAYSGVAFTAAKQVNSFSLSALSSLLCLWLCFSPRLPLWSGVKVQTEDSLLQMWCFTYTFHLRRLRPDHSMDRRDMRKHPFRRYHDNYIHFIKCLMIHTMLVVYIGKLRVVPSCYRHFFLE